MNIQRENKSKNSVRLFALRTLCFFMFLISIIIFNAKAYAITLIDYNNYIEQGRLYNLGSSFDARYNPNVLKYRKYGHFTYDGVIIYPSGNPEMPFNEVDGARILAHQAISTDKTFKITGQFDYDGMDYSYYDKDGLNSYEINRYEFQSRLNSLVVTDRKSEDKGYGAYNFRAGKNIVSFINFAYDFYKNQSGEKRVGCETKDDLAARGITSGDICPMEALKGYEGLSHTNVELFDFNIFNILFRKCTTEWEYQGNKTIANSDSIFANLQYYYMALVYLQPGLRKFKSLKPADFNRMDENDNAAFLSMMYERFGGRPIIPENYEARNMVKGLGEIGEYEILPALIDDGLGMDVGERIYRYMIEIKWKNNPEALARWISEYNEVYGEYEMLNAEDYAIFKKACDEGYRKHASKRSIDTALDFGYVLTPDKFESKTSFDEALAEMADHFQHNFQESQFYKNRNNAEYVARTYAMVKAMCENDAFTDITDIYACIVNLVEHSYGYDSCEILLTDTQVVHLMAPLADGDYDTDQDNLLDKQELSHEENVNISNLLEEYIKYNKLPEEEANKLRADPYIKMWAYKSNPALPDTDFDGRNDDFDIHKPLENRQAGKMSTLNYDEVNFDYNQDYRYFAMKSDQYYYDLSEMSMILANMVNKKNGINRRWLKDTNYVNRIADDGGGITTNSYRERYNAYSVEDYMNYIGLEDIEVRDMSSTYEDSNVCRYAIGHRDVVYSLGRTQNVVRNVIAISIGDIESKAAELYANFDGHIGREGSNTEYHHIGFDIVANRILETIERYASRYDNRYQKVYWITGEGGGGSVANLLAQKMIKKNGDKNVYCYTFQALNTINCNNIPAVQRISNEPYGSIFNLYNDDDFTLKIYTENYKFYKYGVNKHVSVTSNKIYKTIWNHCYNNENEISIKYPTGDNTSLPDYIQYFKNLSEDLSQMVYAFLMTEQDFLDLVFKNPDGYIEKKDDVEAYYQSLQNTGTDYEYLNKYDVPNKKEHTRLLINNMRAQFGLELIPAMQDIGAMPQIANGVKSDTKAPSFGTNGAISIVEEGDTIPFDDVYRMDIKASAPSVIDYNYQGERTSIENINWCYKLEEFKYTNYTLPSQIDNKQIKSYDISYSQFWNKNIVSLLKDAQPNYYENSGYPHYSLYDNNAGDFTFIGNRDNRKTKMIYGRYHVGDNESRRIKVERFGEHKETLATQSDVVIEALTLDGRIISAFPWHLLLKSDESLLHELYFNQMHKYNNYNHATKSDYEFLNYGNTRILHDTASYNRDYNFVDVVMESKDGYQYVIPFIAVDTKNLHHNGTNHFAMLTDNTYGHVFETPNSNGTLTYKYINPIEPYIKVTKSNSYYNGKVADLNLTEDINDKVTEYVFGSADIQDKIVSIRLYDKKFDESDPTWWQRIRDGMPSEMVSRYRDKIETHEIDGIVVDFGKGYNLEDD